MVGRRVALCTAAATQAAVRTRPHVACVGQDALRLWDAATGKCLAVFVHHTDPVGREGWVGEGTRGARPPRARFLLAWCCEPGTCSAKFRKVITRLVTNKRSGPWSAGLRGRGPGCGAQGPSPYLHLQVTCAAWFPDGNSLVTGSHDKQL